MATKSPWLNASGNFCSIPKSWQGFVNTRQYISSNFGPTQLQADIAMSWKTPNREDQENAETAGTCATTGRLPPPSTTTREKAKCFQNHRGNFHGNLRGEEMGS